MNDKFDQIRLLEALLFSAAEPLSPAQMERHLPEGSNLSELLEELRSLYANRGVHLVRVGNRWAFRSAPDLAPHMKLEKSAVRKLSRVAMETLAIIAYHQPVTRAEVEEIRGVALSKGTLDILLEIGWIKPKGRRRTPGKPVTWGTSDAFLDHFGLETLDALPGVEELKAAGLLDARPAVNALAARGALLGPDEIAEDTAPEDEAEDENGDEGEVAALPEDFGEDLVETEEGPHPEEVEADEQLAAEVADSMEDPATEEAVSAVEPRREPSEKTTAEPETATPPDPILEGAAPLRATVG